MGEVQIDPGIPAEDPGLDDLFDLAIAFGAFGQHQSIPHIHIVIHNKVDGIPLLVGLAVDVFHEFHLDQGILGQDHGAGSEAAVGEGGLGQPVQTAGERILGIFRAEDLGFQMAQTGFGRVDGHPVRELPFNHVHHGGHGQLPVYRGPFQIVVELIHPAHHRTGTFLAVHVRFHFVHPGYQGPGLDSAIQEVFRNFQFARYRVGGRHFLGKSRNQAGQAQQGCQKQADDFFLQSRHLRQGNFQKLSVLL